MEALIASFKNAGVFYSLRADLEIRVSDFNNSQNFDKSKPLPCHEWMGVHVDGKGEISRLYWQSKALGGTFVFRLLPRSLETLFIDENNFVGSFVTKDIPPKLGYMSLEGNSFTGSVDWPKLPPSLTFLDIRNNALSGVMDLRRVPRTLETIYIRGNQIRVVKSAPLERQDTASWGGGGNFLLDQSFVEVSGQYETESEESDIEDSTDRNVRLVASDDELDAFDLPHETRQIPSFSSCRDPNTEKENHEPSEWRLRAMRILVYFILWVTLVVVGNLFVF